jgi:hypothetical protein
MAHILVYVQRTPHGIHPASALALCLARDLGSEFGATITAVCPGDAGKANSRVCRATGRYGADALLFTGPDGLTTLHRRLNPGLILVPWTAEGLAVANKIPGDAGAVPHWLYEPQPEWSSDELVTGIIAGAQPWYDLPTVLDADIESDANAIECPPWASDLDPAPTSPLYYLAPPDLDPLTRSNLQSIGAQPVQEDQATSLSGGTLLLLDTAVDAPPPVIEARPPALRVILFPGATPRFHPRWALADWVIPGLWPEATRQLRSELWKLSLA